MAECRVGIGHIAAAVRSFVALGACVGRRWLHVLGRLLRRPFCADHDSNRRDAIVRDSPVLFTVYACVVFVVLILSSSFRLFGMCPVPARVYPWALLHGD